jgi:hypothetical protein
MKKKKENVLVIQMKRKTKIRGVLYAFDSKYFDERCPY